MIQRTKGPMDRRMFVRQGLAMGAGMAAAGSRRRDGKVLILGVSCSPRKGKTTATSVRVALDAAKAVDPLIEVDLIDLGGLEIGGWQGGAKPTEAPVLNDDFDGLLPKFHDPALGGLIIGSPTYFRSMSALCKAFLERLAPLRSPKLLLADKPVGALSVGAYRNGGQELVIQEIQTAMLCHEVMAVGGKPSAHQGATLWNAYNDDIMKDEFGVKSAQLLGARVAEAALTLGE
ncbi:MAG TPA: flavodoxin family protein [Phycisphaerales bacterium]|nr:flavodoxin family protein [Phycisphaerales bacterium]